MTDDADVEGDAFFGQLYEQNAQAIHAYLFGLTGSRESALDLLQETFLRAWRNLDSLEGIPAGRRRFWLFRVARNLATDEYRRRRARSFVGSIDEQSYAEAVTSDFAPSVDARLQLDAAIHALPEEIRTVLLLQVLAGLSSSEIGDILDKPSGTVRYLLSCARAELRNSLRAQELGFRTKGESSEPHR